MKEGCKKENKPKKKWYSELGWLVFVFYITFFIFIRDTDDTDKNWHTRSGMNLRIDYGTGCQYLSEPSIFGSSKLIKRVDSSGKHICK